MPMPHQTFAQLVRRRLVGKEGRVRLRELQRALQELPDYKNGPYADLRKWINAEIERTRVRSAAVHRDSISVRRQGAAQVALVGAPNAGKSSLLQALSDIQIRTGDYAFTTTRPVAAVTQVAGIPIQLVEIPGLLEGACEDRGGGRALLGVLRAADAIVYCHAATSSPGDLDVIRMEVERAGIDLPSIVVATKADEASDGVSGQPDADTRHDLAVSILDDDSLDRLRDAIWRLTGLVRVYLRPPTGGNLVAVAFQPPVTVVDVAAAIHKDLAERCTGARLWGPSARFPAQPVGRDHALVEGDEVEILQ